MKLMFNPDDIKKIKSYAKASEWDQVDHADPNILIFEKGKEKKNNRITIWAKKNKSTFTLGTVFKNSLGSRDSAFFWNLKAEETQEYFKKK